MPPAIPPESPGPTLTWIDQVLIRLDEIVGLLDTIAAGAPSPMAGLWGAEPGVLDESQALLLETLLHPPVPEP